VIKNKAAGHSAPVEAGRQYPPEFIQAHNLLILRENEFEIELGYTAAIDHQLILKLQNFHRKQLRLSAIEPAEMKEILRGCLSKEPPEKESGGKERNTALIREESFLPGELYRDAPLVNLVNGLIVEGLSRRASDIHLEPCRDSVRVRYRIDGIMTEVGRISSSRFPGICSRIKVMARMDIMERRRPQDGSFTIEHCGDRIRMRASLLPTIESESVCLRILNGERSPIAVENLGFNREHSEFLRKLCSRRRGLVLFAGPTGSGKTTTLNSIVTELMHKELKIVSIEDPVEYRLPGITQIETNPKIGLDFATLLRRVLRHDPDVILVGEIRDRETAFLAVQASITGHLVLASIHAGKANDVAGRLSHLGIDSAILPFMLIAVLSQRLLRRTCMFCREQYKPEYREKVLLQKYGIQAGMLMKGRGCAACGGSGYYGRFAAGELLLGTNVERKGLGITEDALLRAASGMTTVSEVLRLMF
jgi:type II secretory ATPase GspE/PulE/Tfp pilus assembly ATPase PilB-like protein